MSHYNTYGKMAQNSTVPDITQNGRYHAQKEAELHIPADVIDKLRPQAEDSFLDIGCGLGLNLKPVSKIVAHAAGCDHPSVIDKIKKLHPDIKADLLPGNFLDIPFPRQYSRILAYSVIPALPDLDTVYAFVDKALSLMSPNGRMLLGDIANINKKERFLNSARGQQFQIEWTALTSAQQQSDDISAFQDDQDKKAVTMNDDTILLIIKHIRMQGYHAYMLEQPHNLPFGNTREDILIIGSEYDEITAQ